MAERTSYLITTVIAQYRREGNGDPRPWPYIADAVICIALGRYGYGNRAASES